MKRSLNIQINFNNKAIYTFVAFIALLIIGMGVFAFGTSTPSTFGHSAGELDLSSGVNGVAVFNEAVCIGGICRTSWSSILDKGSVSTSTSPSISRTITLTESGVITLVGQGRGIYNGVSSNAGIIVLVSIDGSSCGMDQSFEGESFSITFHANAACVKELTAGQHTIKVETIRNGAGATTIENTEMQWVVVS